MQPLRSSTTIWDDSYINVGGSSGEDRLDESGVIPRYYRFRDHQNCQNIPLLLVINQLNEQILVLRV